MHHQRHRDSYLHCSLWHYSHVKQQRWKTSVACGMRFVKAKFAAWRARYVNVKCTSVTSTQTAASNLLHFTGPASAAKLKCVITDTVRPNPFIIVCTLDTLDTEYNSPILWYWCGSYVVLNQISTAVYSVLRCTGKQMFTVRFCTIDLRFVDTAVASVEWWQLLWREMYKRLDSGSYCSHTRSHGMHFGMQHRHIFWAFVYVLWLSWWL